MYSITDLKVDLSQLAPAGRQEYFFNEYTSKKNDFDIKTKTQKILKDNMSRNKCADCLLPKSINSPNN